MISIIPMLLIGSVTLGSLLGLSRSAEQSLERGREELGQDVADRRAQADAVAVAREVDQLLTERIEDVLSWSASPEVRRAARRSAEGEGGDTLALRTDSELEQQFDQDRRLAPRSAVDRYLRDAVARQPVFSELFFTERNGLNVATSGRAPDFVQSDEQWWNAAWQDGLYLSDVEVDEATNTYGVTIASRIDGGQATGPLGVFRATVDLVALQRVATRAAAESGTEVTILTGDGVLLAETRSNHDASRIANANLEMDGDQAVNASAALASRVPGSLVRGDAVAGFSSLSAADGRLPDLLEQFDGVDARPLEWVALVDQSGETTSLSGLSAVQRQLTATARTFAVIVVITLLAALLAAFLVSARLAQRIVRPLRSLGAIARDIADQRLPALVRRAQAPDAGDDLPPIPTVQLDTNDEIEDVADAFNVVCTTAADLAAEQARSRRSVARMFVSLGRRNQNLLSRQLEFIDRLERETSDPDVLEELFRLDHLATRMRRNAESLLVLAGEEPPRRWAEPVSLTDVVRGAVAEVEDYQRVNVDGVDESQLVGSAVSDVSHLLAELIENAAQFSPPDTTVEVVGRRVVDGYSLAVVDDGVGMSEEQLADVNHRLDTSPLVDRVPSSFLGLFVVGRLAARHGIRVRLVESTTEGVTAKVLLPNSLVEPLPRAIAPRELEDVQRRPALEAGSPAGASTRRPFRSSSGSAHRRSVSATTGAAIVFDETQPPRTEGAVAFPPSVDGAAAREVQIDIRESGGDQPADDQPADVGSPGPPHHDDDPGRDSRPVGGAEHPRDDSAEQPDDGDEDQLADADVAVSADEPTAAAGDQQPAAAVFQVRRRASKRTDANGAVANGTSTDGHAVLRTERGVNDAAPSEKPAPRAAPSIPTAVVADGDGVALTAAEREARAARDRLAQFQRAVQRGRAQSRGKDDGGERHDA